MEHAVLGWCGVCVGGGVCGEKGADLFRQVGGSGQLGCLFAAVRGAEVAGGEQLLVGGVDEGQCLGAGGAEQRNQAEVLGSDPTAVEGLRSKCVVQFEQGEDRAVLQEGPAARSNEGRGEVRESGVGKDVVSVGADQLGDRWGPRDVQGVLEASCQRRGQDGGAGVRGGLAVGRCVRQSQHAEAGDALRIHAVGVHLLDQLLGYRAGAVEQAPDLRGIGQEGDPGAEHDAGLGR
ncbi:hypothetical protein [Streptomyces antimycoticus]|uniref:hypothetical protein n=1 Tax=Streptomyces antimycoticus TaxID=68175 RepID=UPI002570C89E|nr:hypothetical protein [Streptomyces antimycoticus]WJE02489.1 hypothetical protein QR300_10195 [Streptomyces antimycoticus]